MILRHFLITTWRSLQANRLQSIIAIFGLSLGLAAAILAGLLIVNQLSFDDFIPGHDNLYFAAIKNPFGLGLGSHKDPDYTLSTPHDLAALFEAVPQARNVARFDRTHLRLRHGEMESREFLYWADPNIFRLLRLPVVHGNLDTALARPDGIVLPVSVARKYFGRDDVVGQIIEINRIHAMTVTAVVADLPENSSNFASAIFASGKAAFSNLARDDLNAPMGTGGKISLDVTTLVQLAPGASVSDAQARITSLVQALVHLKSGPIDVHLIRLDRAHVVHDLAPAVGARLGIFTVVALLILFLGCANFVNISTARAARRGVEVGIRKASGASRAALMAQFLGEGILQALLGLCIATMIVELALPSVNAFLQSGAVFDYWRDPVLALSLLASAVVVGVLAGAYPALVLSAFQPAAVLKGLIMGVGRTVLIRQLLVGLQFVILIVLIAASVIVLEQYRFSIRESLRVNTDQMMFIRDQRCDSPFEAGVRALPGVRGEACSSLAMLPELGWAETVKRHDGGKPFPLLLVPAGYGLFELYGLSPRAGRFFSREHGGDEVPSNPAQDLMAHYVINETAVRQLGFASPQAAIGQRISFDQPPPSHDAPHDKSGGPAALNGTSYSDSSATTRETLDGIVIGVVPDFSLFPSDKAASPIAYSVGWTVLKPQPTATLIHVKLSGRDIPETLDAIDALWRKTVADRPIDRTFLDSYIEDLVVSMLRQGQAFGIFAGIAVLLSCLGLFALTSAAAERRTKEIGIRKAMGASSTDIVLLLLWQFLKPVFWAVVIAVPLAWVLMQRWLSGYASHVMPGPWPYLGAALLALMIALATVITHAILTARAVPATALRYE